MSAFKTVGKFEIGEIVHYDADERLHYVYVGERLKNNFVAKHFRAYGHTPEVAFARAEFMAILWSAARPSDFKIIDKTIEDILNKDPGLLE
jgi:hypothetical protein